MEIGLGIGLGLDRDWIGIGLRIELGYRDYTITITLWSFPGYNKDLSDEVDDETNGDLNKLLVELIKVIYEQKMYTWNIQRTDLRTWTE